MEDSVEATIIVSYMVPEGWSEEMFISWINTWFDREALDALCFCYEIDPDEVVYGFCQYDNVLVFEIGKPTE